MRLGSFSRGRVGAVTTAVVIGSIALAGCAGQEQAGTPAHQVTEWVSGAGAGSSIGTVEVDIKNVNLAFSQRDPAGEIRSVCGLLVTDAGTANGNLPTPDQQLSDDLATAYATAYDAGTDCYNGSGGNQKLLATSATLRAKAQAQMATAIARITAVTGHVPSTTTSTAPAGANVDPFGN
ncbi:MAG TPA: hypothetical protein VHT49_01910 [Acidimicrobiales bacterium]|nr:hypothetical protein [Acidimicrobiales bacterium]